MRGLILSIALMYSVAIFSQSNFAFYFHKRDSLLQLNVGKEYSVFSATALNGRNYSNADLLNKVTILNFWFQYCAPCIAEFDALNRLYSKFSKNPIFQFISFTSDAPEDAKASVEKYCLSFPVCSIDKQECYRLNYNQGFPTSIIIDKMGKVVFVKYGAGKDQTEIEDNIRKYEDIISNLLKE